MNVRLKFVPRDLWIGVFWRRLWTWKPIAFGKQGAFWTYEVYICLLPCLPIVISWERPRV